MRLLPDRGFTHPIASEITPRAVYESRRRWLQQPSRLPKICACFSFVSTLRPPQTHFLYCKIDRQFKRAGLTAP